MSALPAPAGQAAFADAQALVLHSKAYACAQHWLVHADEQANAHGLLHRLLSGPLGQTVAAGAPDKRLQPVQLGIGLTQRGLQRLDLPLAVRAVLQARAPAFAAGAPVRAASALGDHAASGAPCWDPHWALAQLHLVLSVQARSQAQLEQAARHVQAALDAPGLSAHTLPRCAWVPRAGAGPDQHWVHFGYRDALARLHVAGYRTPVQGRQVAAGEFLLGHAQHSGANPWVLATASRHVRGFFHNASFGALRQIEQDEAAFQSFLDEAAQQLSARLQGQDGHGALEPAARHQRLRDFVQAKLMGRWPNGQPLQQGAGPLDSPPAPPAGDPDDDFQYRGDDEGQGCPFGAHVRRMNPRQGRSLLGQGPEPGRQAAADVAHSERLRLLLRRGMPYGPAWQPDERPSARGLMGLFFCASLEEQFEHIVGQWGAGIALGSPDRGSAYDPFVASAQPEGARFVLPLPDGELALPIRRGFVRTRGTAYLLYLSLPALWQLCRQGPWRDDRADLP